ncbi:hypothetical protein Tco_1125406 [Tanacetum coccineum]|uniref:Uncharacterized protein n=1 Tax=Tanacetum coccineum TaxID=301880 RepID=A0ABQ5JA33_9ASTR
MSEEITSEYVKRRGGSVQRGGFGLGFVIGVRRTVSVLLFRGRWNGSVNGCKKTVECVAYLLGRWNGSRGTGAEKTSGRKSKQVALSSVRVAGIRRRQEENKEATRCEHYGGGSSNQVALDVAGEEVVSPGEVGMVMNVSHEMPCYMLQVL